MSKTANSDAAENRSSLPLNAEGYRDLIEVIQTKDNLPENVRTALLLMLFCGLRVSEAAHAHKEWFTEGRNGLELRVPETFPCPKDGGCHRCNAERSRHPDPATWMVKTDGRLIKETGHSKPIPVSEEWTEHISGESRPTELPEQLEWYFEMNDYIDVAPVTIAEWLCRCAKDAGIHNIQNRGLEEKYRGVYPGIKTHDIRSSWCVQCLRSDVRPSKILDWAGWKTYQMLERYRKFLDDPGGVARSKF